MSVETNKLRSASELLRGIQSALETLAWNDAPAFARVEVCDRTDWADAITRLIINENRAALVVYLGDTFSHRVETTTLTGERTTRVGVVLTDRVLGDDITALTGDETRPGTLGLLDTVLPALTGEILAPEAGAKNSVYLMPTSVDRVLAGEEPKKNFPGRSLLLLRFSASGAWLQVGVGESDAR